uniref:FLYWCH-type domain-containing protein n=1 Tax=Ditylenchus dipsaci TaxID=166011 RepID=A0A915CS99_9BILA
MSYSIEELRAAAKLELNDFVYLKQSATDRTIGWRCELHKQGCPGRAMSRGTQTFQTKVHSRKYHPDMPEDQNGLESDAFPAIKPDATAKEDKSHNLEDLITAKLNLLMFLKPQLPWRLHQSQQNLANVSNTRELNAAELEDIHKFGTYVKQTLGRINERRPEKVSLAVQLIKRRRFRC